MICWAAILGTLLYMVVNKRDTVSRLRLSGSDFQVPRVYNSVDDGGMSTLDDRTDRCCRPKILRHEKWFFKP